MSTRDITVIPQYVSAVVLFRGATHLPLTDADVEKAVGSAPSGRGSMGDGGIAFHWPDGLTVLSRIQPPRTNRIEAKQDSPEALRFQTVRDAGWKLLPLAAGRRPVMLGLSSVIIAIETSAPPSELVNSLISTEAASALLGRKSVSASEVTLTTPIRGGTLNVSLKVGRIEALGDATGVLVSTNHNFETPTKAKVTAALSDAVIERVERDARRVIRRFLRDRR